MRTRFELADAVNLFGPGLLTSGKLTPLQVKVLGKIAICRTAALGGHQEECDNCGTVRYSYNSCGDRHCPKCQAAKQAFWIDDLNRSTLPIKHYHIVFTVPHHVYSDDADPRSGHADPPLGLTSFVHCQIGTV